MTEQIAAQDLVEIRRARAWLSRAVEPGQQVVHDLVTQYGPVTAANQIRAGVAPEPVRKVVGDRATEDRVDEDLDSASRLGVRLLIPEDDEWPTTVLHAMWVAASRGVPDIAPPLALWVRGPARLDETVARAVSVVGARAATDYGCHIAREMSYGLAEHEWAVVSGGAYGIDGNAHRGALAAEGVTVAVIAGGLGAAYPVGHTALFERILETGLLVSEWPSGCTPQRHRFLIRNRLIAALGAGTVVVEAAARSGTQSTARHSRQLGRPVMAVPGSIVSALSTGCHQLIRDHNARLVTTVSQILEEIGAVGELAPRPNAPADPGDGLEELPSRVLDAVPATKPATPERIAVEAGATVSEVLRCLPALELLDLVEVTDTGWRLAPVMRRRRRRARGGPTAIR